MAGGAALSGRDAVAVATPEFHIDVVQKSPIIKVSAAAEIHYIGG